MQGCGRRAECWRRIPTVCVGPAADTLHGDVRDIRERRPDAVICGPGAVIIEQCGYPGGEGAAVRLREALTAMLAHPAPTWARGPEWLSARRTRGLAALRHPALLHAAAP